MRLTHRARQLLARALGDQRVDDPSAGPIPREHDRRGESAGEPHELPALRSRLRDAHELLQGIGWPAAKKRAPRRLIGGTFLGLHGLFNERCEPNVCTRNHSWRIEIDETNSHPALPSQKSSTIFAREPELSSA